MKLVLNFENMQELPDILDCIKMQVNNGNTSGAAPDWYVKANEDAQPVTSSEQIDRVITVLLKPHDMETVNKLMHLDINASDNWVDLGMFEYSETLKNYISFEQYQALLNGQADFIAFRIDY